MAKQLTAEQIALRDHLTRCYNELNAYDLVLRYVASQRPKKGSLKSDAEEGFLIHTLKPSFRDTITGVVTNLQACEEFNLKLPWPEVEPEDKDDMKIYWRSLVTGVTDKQFFRHEARKYMKFSKLQPLNHTFKKGLKLGKRYISEDGDMNLLNLLKRKGYKVGNFYPCQQLLEDIESLTGGKGVKVDYGTIPPIKNQVLQDVRFLNEVCILYDDEAENRVTERRPQAFDSKNSVFLLEDLDYRKQ